MPITSNRPVAPFPPNTDVRFEVNPDRAPAPALAPLVADLPDVPVMLDRARSGPESPDDPSDAALPPIAVGESPNADDDPGVARPCRAWGIAEINCAVVAWAFPPTWVPAAWAAATAWPASPAGLVVCGGGAKMLKAEAEAEFAIS
jgi:hypothetical protein